MPVLARSRASARKYTWDDFVALDDDDRRELVDGELVEVEVPTKWHEKLVALLAYHLQGWAMERKLHVLASGYKVRVAADRGAMPDVQVLKDSVYRATANDQGLVRGKPELVVEIISPSSDGSARQGRARTGARAARADGRALHWRADLSSRRFDRLRKSDWYASLGVREYWIVDVDERSIERFVLRGKLYALAQHAQEDEVFRPTSMKGLEIPLARLWDALPRTRKRPSKTRR